MTGSICRVPLGLVVGDVPVGVVNADAAGGAELLLLALTGGGGGGRLPVGEAAVGVALVKVVGRARADAEVCAGAFM